MAYYESTKRKLTDGRKTIFEDRDRFRGYEMKVSYEYSENDYFTKRISGGKNRMHYTKHINDRMRQRNIKSKEVDLILSIGELNNRGDRTRLSKKAIYAELEQGRAKINMLENLLRRGGGTVVTDGNTLITVYANTKRVLS